MSFSVAHPIPSVPGILTGEQVAATAASIARMQEPSGAVPWTPGDKVDVWNHVEAAMAMLVGGQVEAAERAYDWVLDLQRSDGSWPMKVVDGVVEDHSGETNMSAYLAVGVWHHWLVCRDLDFVRKFWPAVKSGLDWVVRMQLPFGGIAWSQEWTGPESPGPVNADALVAGSSSIHQALAAGRAIGELLDEPQPEWEMAGSRLAHALAHHRDLFLDKSPWSMDWYYPVLGGAVRGQSATDLLASKWEIFVEPGLGIRCISENPWVTGAETCELVMALDANGDRARALALFSDMQHLRMEDGSYWTGYVFPDEVNWPGEQTTYTAAAVILAADQLSGATPGSDIMRGSTLPVFEPMPGACLVSPTCAAGRASTPVLRRV